MNFPTIDGVGDPNDSQSFQDAVDALFSLSYAIKFKIKKCYIGIDLGVLPLEGLWWADDMTEFSTEKKDNWKWTLMIMQPEIVDKEMIVESVEQVRKKKSNSIIENQI